MEIPPCLLDRGTNLHGKLLLFFASFVKITPVLELSMTTESKGAQTKMLLVYVGTGDSSKQPKMKIQRQELQG